MNNFQKLPNIYYGMGHNNFCCASVSNDRIIFWNDLCFIPSQEDHEIFAWKPPFQLYYWKQIVKFAWKGNFYDFLSDFEPKMLKEVNQKHERTNKVVGWINRQFYYQLLHSESMHQLSNAATSTSTELHVESAKLRSAIPLNFCDSFTCVDLSVLIYDIY